MNISARNRESRAGDWGKLIKWVYASDHRQSMIESVARANRAGKFPNQTEAMGMAHRTYWAKSMITNGSQAIRDLISEGLLVNRNPKRGAAKLEVAWDFIGVLSDWQTDQGLPRLDERLRVC